MPKFESIEQALEEAHRILSKQYDQVDQQAAVRLAETLYALRDRARFEERDTAGETPYRT